jgi:hypothetical protein
MRRVRGDLYELAEPPRKARLSLADLYAEDGIYGRWNWKALAAGVAAALIGLVVPGLRILYDYSWFVGFAVAFGLCSPDAGDAGGEFGRGAGRGDLKSVILAPLSQGANYHAHPL